MKSDIVKTLMMVEKKYGKYLDNIIMTIKHQYSRLPVG